MSTVQRSAYKNQNIANGLTGNFVTDQIDLEKYQIESHREQLKRKVDRLAGLLKGEEIRNATIEFLSNTSDGGAPSNTPVHSPKRYTYSPSRYYEELDGKKIKSLKLLEKLKESEDEHEHEYIDQASNHEGKFLSVRDLLTSENNHDSTTQQHSSPLGDKTLDFINQTSMTPNNTLYHAQFHQEQFQSIKRYDADESSTVVPLDVLDDTGKNNKQVEDNANTMVQTNVKSVDITITSSPSKKFVGAGAESFNDAYNESFMSRNQRRDQMFSNLNDEKIYYANVLDLEVSKNLLALSSSPMPKFETKFPDPKPIHEFFNDDVGIDDAIGDALENTESEEVSENNQIDEEDDENSTDEEFVAKFKEQEVQIPQSQVRKPVRKGSLVSKSNHQQKDQSRQKAKKGKKVQIEPVAPIQSNFTFKSDDIDEELKNPENNTSYYSSPQNLSYRVSNIRASLRKRKPVTYNVETISNLGYNDDLNQQNSPKSSRQKRRDLRMKKATSTTSSSPAKRTPSSSSSNKSSSYRRKRTVAPRSKSGCWTCRIRKKKCTEEKPSCLQCDKLGLRCDGYSEAKPTFMQSYQSQRKRLDEIRNHTSQRKKIGVKKVRQPAVEFGEQRNQPHNVNNENNENNDNNHDNEGDQNI